MPRQKKTRKIGRIGVPKDTTSPRPKKTDTRKKKHTGKRPGSRNSELLKKDTRQIGSAQQDSRIGSKKPIPLVPAETKRFKSPQDELDYIENNPELQALLDKQEEGVSLSTKEQKKLEEMLARHQLLCELLGIADDFDEDALDESTFDESAHDENDSV